MTKERKKLMEQVDLFFTEKLLIDAIHEYYVCTCTKEDHPCSFCQSTKLLKAWRSLDRKEKRKV